MAYMKQDTCTVFNSKWINLFYFHNLDINKALQIQNKVCENGKKKLFFFILQWNGENQKQVRGKPIHYKLLDHKFAKYEDYG